MALGAGDVADGHRIVRGEVEGALGPRTRDAGQGAGDVVDADELVARMRWRRVEKWVRRHG